MDHIFEDIFLFCDTFGLINDAAITENEGHLSGTFYIQFKSSTSASQCLENLKGKWYAGLEIKARFVRHNALFHGQCKKYFRNDCTPECCLIHPYAPKFVKELYEYNSR